MDRHPRGDASLLAAHREEGVGEGRAGPHHSLADVGEVIAQHPADGTLRDHLHRSRHQRPSTVGRNREHSQRLHLGLDRQAAVLLDLQIARHLHHRFGGNGVALGVVEINSGPDRRDGHMKGGGRGPARLGLHIHEHQIGGGAVPIGEMRKVQGRPPGLRLPDPLLTQDLTKALKDLDNLRIDLYLCFIPQFFCFHNFT